MGTTQTDYTGLNVYGLVTMQTGALTGLSLASAVTLTEAQAVNGIIEIATGHASNAITIPAAIAAKLKNKLYIVSNADASLASNIKVEGGTAVTVAATKTAIVRINNDGDEVVRVTTDA